MPPTAPGGLPTTQNASNDICPVCKSSRYLNPNMKLKVNPECWHRMCESCVERIFGHGPAPCPIAGCKRTLRKARFREQTFEDVKIEREIEIRKEVNDLIRMRQDDYSNLREYNDFLEDMEEITFNLINNKDVTGARASLDKYRKEHANEIAANIEHEKSERAEFAAMTAEQRERELQNRQIAMRQLEEEEKFRQDQERSFREQLAKGGDANKLASRLAKVQQERAIARKYEAQRAQSDGDGMVIRGKMREKEAPKTEVPYSPFAGLHLQRQEVPREVYHDETLDERRQNPKVTAGGYDFEEYCQRALSDAFSGLGVFVGDEMAAREGGVPNAALNVPKVDAKG
ncbi:MAG: hypothetical protein Q9162_000908 [Coniocarpon cinnabarinum]